MKISQWTAKLWGRMHIPSLSLHLPSAFVSNHVFMRTQAYMWSSSGMHIVVCLKTSGVFMTGGSHAMGFRFCLWTSLVSFSFWITSSKTHSQRNFWSSTKTGSMIQILLFANWAFRKLPAWPQLSMRYKNKNFVFQRDQSHTVKTLILFSVNTSETLSKLGV